MDWRARYLRSGRDLNWTTTRCAFASVRNVDDWFAHQELAKPEIEAVLAATGHRMIQELLSQEVLPGQCRLQSNEVGEIKRR